MPNLVGVAPPSSDLSVSLTSSSPMTSMPRFRCEQRRSEEEVRTTKLFMKYLYFIEAF
jgi:hypothetical protein